MQTVSQTYIDGIKEGRAFLNANPDLTREEMTRAKDAASDLMKSHAQPMKDLFKGERDFWNNQLKKA